MELMNLIETIRAEDLSKRQVFTQDDGRRVRGRQHVPTYLASLVEAANLVEGVCKGRIPMHRLQEAMSTSDFPYLFGDVLDRQLLGNYREITPVWRSFAKVGTVRDFRDVKRKYIDGGEGQLDRVAEGGEYPAVSVSDGEYTYSVKKYGKRLPFTWETLVNDDLDAFRDLPARLARGARRTESKFATGLYIDANGPHASFFTTGNKNIINTTNGAASTNPALSVAALQQAMIVLSKMVDSDGEPIEVETVMLVVPPALKVTAQNILNGTQLELTEAGGTSNQKLVVANWMRNTVTLVVDPYIPVVASSANGDTSWFLFCSPMVGRPAIEIGFLNGMQEPALFIKEPNARRVGGGAVSPFEGDFDTDAIEYKIRHVFGGTTMSGKAAVSSNGSSS